MQRVHHADDVVCLIDLLETSLCAGRKAHAPQIGHDHRVIARKVRRERPPHVSGLAIAMQQHDRRSRPADPDVEGRAIGRDLFGVEGVRKIRRPVSR
ncbi:hypothetical protein ACVW0I_003362 [Bradyrhizobium sp. LM6.11]